METYFDSLWGFVTNMDLSFRPGNWQIAPFVEDGARLCSTPMGGAESKTLADCSEVWVSAGSIPRNYTITATHPFVAEASDTATFTSILLDISVDSNHDGVIDDSDNPIKESAGGFTATNVLRRINLAFDNGSYDIPPGEIVLKVVSGGGKIVLWEDLEKEVPVVLDAEGTIRWSPSEMPNTVYAEGIEASTAPRDIEVILEYEAYSSSFELQDRIRLTVIEVKFLEDETTCYNFSPSLGEVGEFKVQVSPLPPTEGYGGIAFHLYVVRECEGGTEQFVDWIDVSDSANSIRRFPLNFGIESFQWDGIRDYGVDLPAASGPETFQGVSSTEYAHRSLPPSNVGEAVPPLICTVVARVYNPKTYEVLSETRKHVFIPQVVLLLYENNAVSLLRTELKASDGTLLYPAITRSQWAAMKTQIKAQIEEFYDQTEANIRIVDSTSGLLHPYTIVRVVKGDLFWPSNIWGWGGGCDFHNLQPNANPSDDMAKVSICGHREIIEGSYNKNVLIPTLPLSCDNLSWSIAITACHELGHSLGLVYNNTILNGTPYPSCHNSGIPPPGLQWHLQASPTLKHLDPESSWGWKNINIDYLKFILPKGEE